MINRKEKIKLLQQLAKGDTSAYYQINKPLQVKFLSMVSNEGYWIDFFNLTDPTKDVDAEYKPIDEILKDENIRKYTTTELKQIRKRRFVFAFPPELLINTDEKIREFYNRYFAK